MKKETQEGEGKQRGGRVWPRALLCAAAGAVALLAAIVALAPTIATRINYPELVFDLSTNITGKAASLVSNKTARVKFFVSRGTDTKLSLHAEGVILDWPFSAEANIDWTWRLFGVDASGDASLRIDGSPWAATAMFSASSSGEWEASAEMPATAVDESDPVTGAILSRLETPGIENLSYGATVSFKGSARQAEKRPCPEWSASARIKNCDISLEANGAPVRVSGLQMGVGAKGIADHADISPMFPHAAVVEGAGFTLSNVFASVRATEAALLVTEAGARLCGGDIKMYSFFLDPKRLNAGLTLFIDGLDAGETLRHFKGFNGEASGRLHGKLPLVLRNGSEIKLGPAYLYSTPGETGTIRIFDPKPIVDHLELGGVSASSRDNLAKALANLDYTALSMRLKPEGANSMAMAIKVEGSSTHGETTVPVSFGITLHGDLETILNTGIKASAKRQQGVRK